MEDLYCVIGGFMDIKLAMELIKQYEGYKEKAYLCPAGVWTIGFGTTVYPDGTPVRQGDVINDRDAIQYLNDHCFDIKLQIKKLIKEGIELNHNQMAALICFVYNVGIGAFKTSTMRKKINLGADKWEVSKEFLRWNKANGVELLGLTRRRISEVHLWEKLV
jgi:lysozyme